VLLGLSIYLKSNFSTIDKFLRSIGSRDSRAGLIAEAHALLEEEQYLTVPVNTPIIKGAMALNFICALSLVKK
jgi:hypothetical protein